MRSIREWDLSHSGWCTFRSVGGFQTKGIEVMRAAWGELVVLALYLDLLLLVAGGDGGDRVASGGRGIVGFRLVRLPCTTGTLRPIVDGRAVRFRRNGRLRACMGGLGGLVRKAGFRGTALRRVITRSSNTVFGGTKRALGRGLCFARFSPCNNNEPANTLTGTVSTA